MTIKSKDFDAQAFVTAIKFPAKTFLTVDPEGGYLTVSGFGDLGKAKKVWEKAGATITTDQLSQVRDLFAPKSGSAAALASGLQVWCMKCKVNVALKNPLAQIKNGKAMTKGECEQCGGVVYSFKAVPDETIHGTASLSPDKPMTKEQKVAYVKGHSKKSGKAKADATMLSNIEGMTEARLDKWIASWKAQEAGVKAAAMKAEAAPKKAATSKATSSKPSRKTDIELPKDAMSLVEKKLASGEKGHASKFVIKIGKAAVSVMQFIMLATGLKREDIYGHYSLKTLISICKGAGITVSEAK
jgi:hypothetical protein